MEQLPVLEKAPRTLGHKKLNRNSKLFKAIISAIKAKKGENIISLDMKDIVESVSDFFVICQASSTTQVKAIADNIRHEVEEVCGELPYKHEGHAAAQWVLIDYVSIVVHVMLPAARDFYRLEEMWEDANAKGHDEENED